MTALAAARLGYRCHVFAPEPDGPAAQVADRATVAPLRRRGGARALRRVRSTWSPSSSRTCRLDALGDARRARRRCARRRRARDLPGPAAREGVPGADRRADGAPCDRCAMRASWPRRCAELGGRGVLKTARFGYDGKGQVRARRRAPTPARAWAALGGAVGVARGLRRLRRRGLGDHRARPRTAQVQLSAGREPPPRPHPAQTIAPAPIAAGAGRRGDGARRRHRRARWSWSACWRSRCSSPATARLLVNELAPRPHNSGHWTIDACASSQFEQLVRAVCGLPLGAPARVRRRGDGQPARRGGRAPGPSCSPSPAPACTSTASARSGPAASWAM